MQDVTPNDRSIRNIPVSGSSHRRSAPSHEPNPEEIPLPRKRRRSRKLLWWTLGMVVVCGVAGLLLATLFEGATVTVTPKTQTIVPPANITALPDAQDGTLGYQTITLSQSATTSATASGTAHVSTQASGVVTISNVYSASPQQLVANTRFQAPDGRIYRIRSGVTVPGDKKNADGSLVPGTIAATIYADAPGANYNRTDSTTFTIPGFKGDPRYSKFSAQSQGEISGGFVGDRPAVSDADMQKAKATLQSQLDQAINAQIRAQTPPGFMPVQGSLQTTYSDIASAQGQGSSVSLTQSVTASIAIINGKDLASILAKLLVSGYQGEPVAFGNPNPLVLQLASSTTDKTGPLTILLQGSPTLVWQFDQNALKQKLLGINKNSFQSVVDTFQPAVEKAQASIRPFWKATFPTDQSKLDIVVQD